MVDLDCYKDNKLFTHVKSREIPACMYVKRDNHMLCVSCLYLHGSSKSILGIYDILSVRVFVLLPIHVFDLMAVNDDKIQSLTVYSINPSLENHMVAVVQWIS